MSSIDSQALVETDWLSEHLKAPDILVVDASWHLPTAGRSGHSEYMAAHIPGARFFDINAVSDEASNLPHMLPSTVKFASAMKALGIGDGVRVVAYDADGIFAAARVWWMLRVMGHHDVGVLNGGLAKWRAEGRDVTSEPPDKRARIHFTPRMEATLLADLDDVKALSARALDGTGQIVDARPAGRFAGRDPEPREGLAMGHIPGSLNVPYSGMLNGDGTMKPAGELREIFKAAGIDPKAKVTATCGSGVTAAIVALALAQVGNDRVPVYDGSWAQWGDPANELPIAKG